MTVLVLSYLFPNERYQNSGIFVLEQIKALREEGTEVRVIAPRPWVPPGLQFLPCVRRNPPAPQVLAIDGFKVQRPKVLTLPKNMSFAGSGLLFYLACRSLVSEWARNTRIDVIHAHTLVPCGFAAVLLGREFSLPVVCTGHGSDVNVYPFNGHFAHRASTWAARNVDTLVTVSDNLKGEVLNLIGTREITVVRNGGDSANFKPLDKIEARCQLHLSPTRELVCFVGYLRAEKGVEYLLEAFRHLNTRGTQLCIVGDGPLRQSLIAQAAQLGILEQCLFVGEQPHQQIPLWISAADCVVMPSLSEGFPTIVAETMLCRVPIIATPVGGIPEVIRNRDTGLLVPCRDPAALRVALDSLLSDPQAAAKLADNAYALAQSSLTWQANAQQMLDVYENTVRRYEELRRDRERQLTTQGVFTRHGS